jgi:hypothetical protein
MKKKQRQALDRRNFLKVAAGSGAALAATPASMAAQRLRAPQADSGTAEPSPRTQATGKPGSDFMVDVFKPLGFEYIAVLPHSQFPRAARIHH